MRCLNFLPGDHIDWIVARSVLRVLVTIVQSARKPDELIYLRLLLNENPNLSKMSDFPLEMVNST